MRAILYEHNTLNGFRFVFVEFVFVALVALLLGVATWRHGDRLWAVGWLGMAVNAAAVCGTVIEQMRRGERSNTSSAATARATRSGSSARHTACGQRTRAWRSGMPAATLASSEAAVTSACSPESAYRSSGYSASSGCSWRVSAINLLVDYGDMANQRRRSAEWNQPKTTQRTVEQAHIHQPPA